jgi:glucosyl-dolichyl phosphate glucuronosyltransferase
VVNAHDRHPMRELSAAVIICTSARDRSPLLHACIDSVFDGTRRPEELFVVVDGDRSLEVELAHSLDPAARVLPSAGHGLSAARNTGLAAAASDLVAFIDDDAEADRGWLESLVRAFASDRDLVGSGGPVLPRWGAERRWMPDELLWVVGCTYQGHRKDAGPMRNPIGCNMAFRRRSLVSAGGFCTTFGKDGRSLQTCDETELGLRLERVHGPGRIVYAPDASVHHFVPSARISWRVLVRRSISEGIAKGRLRRLYRNDALGPERDYVRLLVFASVPRLIRESVQVRDPQRAVGAMAIAASLLIAGAAFVAGLAREASPGTAAHRSIKRPTRPGDELH